MEAVTHCRTAYFLFRCCVKEIPWAKGAEFPPPKTKLGKVLLIYTIKLRLQL